MSEKETAVFGGGCFWCTEAVFKMLKGVNSVLPGYSGGTTENPSYEEISGGASGHAEVVKVEFDPSQVKYRTLLTIFFASHDPAAKNRQGPDIGTQYRSVIFYTTPEQKKEVEDFIAGINAENPAGKPVVTELVPFDKFYQAEDFHQNYYEKNQGDQYCELVINPKLEKMQKQFGELLKDLYKT